MKTSLSLRMSQNLALTPQLQQSIRLLQLSTLELNQEIEHMLDENPFLESAEESTDDFDSGLIMANQAVSSDDQLHENASEFEAKSTDSSSSKSEFDAEESSGLQLNEQSDWEGAQAADSPVVDEFWAEDVPSYARKDDDAPEANSLAGELQSLDTFLQEQIRCLRLSVLDRAALDYLIGNLNDDGYLEDDLPTLAQSLSPEPGQVEDLLDQLRIALNLLQSLEPAGVGARNLQECLLIQLRSTSLADAQAVAVAQRVMVQPMELQARRDHKKLASLTGDTETDIKNALTLIRSLEPKPGRRFAQVERLIVVPDVIVTTDSANPPNNKSASTPTGFKVTLNPEVLPRLKVHDVYANALREHKGEGPCALTQRLQEARWFIKNIQQRFDTILRVSTAIVERQKNFFIHGALAMRPLVLREIADELGLHESTISRVTTAKYMATPHGTFELKYFFGSALGTDSGAHASSTAVRALIKQIMAEENPCKPLSDQQISALLKNQGIDCARRTVAKYREALRIAPANMRKQT